MGTNERTAAEHCGRAIALKSRGKLIEAAVECEQALAVEPDSAVAWNILGNVRQEQRKYALAIGCYERALQREPRFPQAANNLGNTLQHEGRLEEAVTFYRQAVEWKPDYALAYNNLGNALRRLQRPVEAEASCRRAIELAPGYAEAHYNLGLTLESQSRVQEAVALYCRAVELKPDFGEARVSLGDGLRALGRFDDAANAYRAALRCRLSAEVCNRIGIWLIETGRLDEAAAACRRALEIDPRFVAARSNLGEALRQQWKLVEAVSVLQSVVATQADFPEAHNNLGNALQELGRLDESIACFRRALELRADFAAAHNNLGNAFKYRGDAEQVTACYRRALEHQPQSSAIHSNYLVSLQYLPQITLAALAEAHAEWDRRHAIPLQVPARTFPNDRSPDRPLRLGFVSADFGRHPVGWFLIRVLEALDLRQYQTFCYSDRRHSDDMTGRFIAAASTWRPCVGVSDERLAEQIQADGIDILFDLAGHTAHNRLLVFARRPAPVQVTWIGYVGTTGLRAMDYLLADRFEVPQGAETHYREKVLRLPHGYICYAPPAEAPAVGPLPALSRGHVTFASFNNPVKINDQVVRLWSEILRRVPGSRLAFQYRGLDDQTTQRRYRSMFAAAGVAEDRISFSGRSSHPELLAQYNQVDIGLDPFPYSGGLTTCEALWMGVPVVTWPGETFAGRHSLTHLSNAGLTETIARDADEYADLAVGLAGDLRRLAGLRSGLRRRMHESPLCDAAGFSAAWTALLRDVWREWCRSAAPA